MKDAETEKRKAAYRRKSVFLRAATIALGALAIGCLIGLIVVVIMLNLKKDGLITLYILTGSFTGGALLLACAALGVSRLMERAHLRELDFRERCDSQDSFFVGEGTLATFGESGIVIHDETDGKKEKIDVPYAEMRFFSVCTRKSPREDGKWSVVLEIPLKYLAKEGKAKKNDPPALVETDGKERLYLCLEKYGRELLGEAPPRGEQKRAKGKTFKPVKKFYLPNRAKRKRALAVAALGGALLVAGVLVAVFWQITLGAVLGAVGVLIGGKALFSFLRAKAVFAVYREGIYYSDSAGSERRFLKGEEIGRFSEEEKDGIPLLKACCLYGDYTFPMAKGAREALEEVFPEKCGDLKCGN